MNELLALLAILFLLLWITVVIKKPTIITWEELTKQDDKPKKKKVEVEQDDECDMDVCYPDGGAGGSGGYGAAGESYVSSRYLDQAQAQISNLQNMLAQQQSTYAHQYENQLRGRGFPSRPALFNVGQSVTHMPSGEHALVGDVKISFTPRDGTYERVYRLSNGMTNIPERDLI